VVLLLKKNEHKNKGLNSPTMPNHSDNNVERGFVPFYEFMDGLDAMSHQPPAEQTEDAPK